jgi:two-component system, OmpR family, alkaline phosphatase synthesis response regulator PhoP
MKHKILIIEDEKLIVVALKKKLESEGFDVETEYDGVSGLRAALGMHPDLILLDIILPGIDGVTLLSSLRADEWGAKVPVIILTNLNDASTIEESRKKGVNSYLVKTDWKLNDVVDKVRSTLDEVGGSVL